MRCGSDMGLQRLVRRRDVAHDASRIDVVRRHAVGERLVGEHEAMAQHVRREVGHVLGQHVVAAAQVSQRAAALDEVDRSRGLAPKAM